MKDVVQARIAGVLVEFSQGGRPTAQAQSLKHILAPVRRASRPSAAEGTEQVAHVQLQLQMTECQNYDCLATSWSVLSSTQSCQKLIKMTPAYPASYTMIGCQCASELFRADIKTSCQCVCRLLSKCLPMYVSYSQVLYRIVTPRSGFPTVLSPDFISIYHRMSSRSDHCCCFAFAVLDASC